MSKEFEQFYEQELRRKGIIHIAKQDAKIVFNALTNKEGNDIQILEGALDFTEDERDDYRDRANYLGTKLDVIYEEKQVLLEEITFLKNQIRGLENEAN